MKRYMWMILLFVIFPAMIYAQEVLEGETSTLIPPNAGHYLVGIIAGFVLAIAFQLILTNLSVAAGLEVASTATKKSSSKNSRTKVNTSDDSNTLGESVRAVSSAFGIWTLITATIALFFASWLAAELSLTMSQTVGAVMGLVIWGLFYVAMMTIEVNALSSLAGSLIKLASAGLRTAYNTASSVFTKSDTQKIEDTAARVTSAVKEEIFGSTDNDDIVDKLKDYIKEIKPYDFNPHNIAKEFAKVLNNTEIKAIIHSDPVWDNETVYAELKNKGLDEGRARKLASNATNIMAIIKEEMGKDKSMADKILDGSMKAAGVPSQEVKKTRQKFEEYLRSTGKAELDPEALKSDLERLFSDPSGAVSSLKERLSHIDRETITNAVSRNSDMSRAEVEEKVDRVYSIIEKLKYGIADYKDGILNKMRDYLDSLDNPELRYDDVTRDVQKLFHDPKAGIESLMHRIKSIDRDTIKSILSHRKDISEEDAERIITKIETARDNFKMKFEQMQHEIKRRIETVKEEALHQADEVRKTAATAAWWAFATAIVSGIGAVLGGIVASNTF